MSCPSPVDERTSHGVYDVGHTARSVDHVRHPARREQRLGRTVRDTLDLIDDLTDGGVAAAGQPEPEPR
jgi:hypothetical protein